MIGNVQKGNPMAKVTFKLKEFIESNDATLSAKILASEIQALYPDDSINIKTLYAYMSDSSKASSTTKTAKQNEGGATKSQSGTYRNPSFDNIAKIISALSQVLEREIFLDELLFYQEDNDSLFVEANKLLEKGEIEEALSLCESRAILEENSFENNPGQAARIMLATAKIYYQLGKINEALQYCETIGEELFEVNLMDSYVVIEALIGKAACLSVLGNTLIAYKTFEKAQEAVYQLRIGMNSRSNKRLLILEATILRGQGDARRREGYLTGALIKYELAISILEQLKGIDAKTELAHAYNSLGSAFDDLDKIETALKYNTIARDIRKDIKDIRGEAYSYYDLGNVNRKLARSSKGTAFILYIHEAEQAYTKAFEIAKRIGDMRLASYAQRGQGHILRMQGNHQEAIAKYAEAAIGFNTCGDCRAFAYVLLGQAKSYRSLSKPEATTNNLLLAKTHLLRALEIFKNVKDVRGQKHTLNLLGRLHYKNYSNSFFRSHPELIQSKKYYEEAEKIQPMTNFEAWYAAAEGSEEKWQMMVNQGVKDRSVAFTFLGLASISFREYEQALRENQSVERIDRYHAKSDWYYVRAFHAFDEQHFLGIGYTFLGRGQLRLAQAEDFDDIGKFHAQTYFQSAKLSFEAIQYTKGLEKVDTFLKRFK